MSHIAGRERKVRRKRFRGRVREEEGRGREKRREGGREGGTGKAKPGKRCWENKAGLSKADTDTDTQA